MMSDEFPKETLSLCRFAIVIVISDFLTWAETGMALFTRSLSGIGPQQSTNPATTGCPLAARECRQTHDHASLRANGAAIRVGDAS
jgi:hypothetical protein